MRRKKNMVLRARFRVVDDGFWNEWHWRKKQEKAGFVNKIEQKQNSLKKSVLTGNPLFQERR